MQISAASCLQNGLRVEVTELPHLHSATVSLFVQCGSQHESAAQWGLSHLLEHMLFRGSARFASTQALALAFERAGGTLEAETWRDHTHLSVTAHPSHLTAVLEALADMVIAPRFADLHIEKQIVATELQAELDERGRDIDITNVSRAQVWGAHPMGRRIIGSMKSLKSFTRDDVVAWHAAFYGARNAVLSVAGPVQHEAILRVVADLFGPMSRGRPATRPPSAVFRPNGLLAVRPRPGAQVCLQMTFAALPDAHSDFLAQTLLVNVLDDGMASRLQQAICERRGLVYALVTGLDCYSDCGLYDIEMTAAPHKAAAAIAQTLDTLSVLLERGVTQEEFQRARQRSLHALDFQADSPSELAQTKGAGRLLGVPHDAAQQAQRLNEIGAEDVNRVARHLFAGRPPHLTLMGATHRADLKRIEEKIAKFSCQAPPCSIRRRPSFC